MSTPIFGWSLANLVVKNGHEKDKCHDKIGLVARIKDTILASIVYTSYFCISTSILTLQTTISYDTHLLTGGEEKVHDLIHGQNAVYVKVGSYTNRISDLPPPPIDERT